MRQASAAATSSDSGAIGKDDVALWLGVVTSNFKCLKESTFSAQLNDRFGESGRVTHCLSSVTLLVSQVACHVSSASALQDMSRLMRCPLSTRKAEVWR